MATLLAEICKSSLYI